MGAFSRRVEALDLDGRQMVLAQLDELPKAIGVFSWRVVVPVMAKLSDVRLNLLAAEAVATAIVLDAFLARGSNVATARGGVRALRHRTGRLRLSR
ncbi:MAG: hypothetical protein ACR2G7_02465 [Acidimicrobiales bacterium]